MILQELEWAVDLVNEVYGSAEHSNGPLASIVFARQALIDQGITEHAVIANILKRSLYADVTELNLRNTLELF